MIVDLRGSQGNAFVLLGYARRWAKELDLDGGAICSQMMSADYENLLKVMQENFPFVEFIMPEQDE
jgi:hypothetical protein